IAQYLQLRDAARHPEVLSTNTAEAFERLGAAASLPVKSATVRAESARLWQQVQAMLRLVVSDKFDEDNATLGQRQALVRATRARDFDELKLRLSATAETVAAAFKTIIEAPAYKLAAQHPDKAEQPT
ncbi:MAG: glutamate-ammonia-ligase adenylyltransferase, partial [Alphaproteobacteria bacterium]